MDPHPPTRLNAAPSTRPPRRARNATQLRHRAADPPRRHAAAALARLLATHAGARCRRPAAALRPPRAPRAARERWQLGGAAPLLCSRCSRCEHGLRAGCSHRPSPTTATLLEHGARSRCSRSCRRGSVTGFVTALMGFWVTLVRRSATRRCARRAHHAIDDARTAIVMPICNEDVATVFAGLRATCESLAATGHARCSTSSCCPTATSRRSSPPSAPPGPSCAPRWPRTRTAADRGVLPLARHRIKRKAGNVADFCRRWGRDYRYMVVLDADSVMSGDCLVSLVR